MGVGDGGKTTPPWWSVFVSANGMALIWYEAVYSATDRIWLLALAGGMVGILPASLLDTWLGKRNGRGS